MDWPTLTKLPLNPEAKALSKDLKKRGWSFVGPTTVYSAMESVGLVNDHMDACYVRPAVDRDRKRFRPP